MLHLQINQIFSKDFIFNFFFLGFVRDTTGSYKNCIIIFNSLTLFTIVAWSAEFLIRKLKYRNVAEINLDLNTDPTSQEQSSILLTSL